MAILVGHRGIGFAGQAIEGGEGVVNVIGLWRQFASFLQTFACLVPAAEIHHADAALIVVLRRFRALVGGGLHALFHNAHMYAGAVDKFLAGAFQNLFQFLLGTLEFVLVKGP